MDSFLDSKYAVREQLFLFLVDFYGATAGMLGPGVGDLLCGNNQDCSSRNNWASSMFTFDHVRRNKQSLYVDWQNRLELIMPPIQQRFVLVDDAVTPDKEEYRYILNRAKELQRPILTIEDVKVIYHSFVQEGCPYYISPFLILCDLFYYNPLACWPTVWWISRTVEEPVSLFLIDILFHTCLYTHTHANACKLGSPCYLCTLVP